MQRESAISGHLCEVCRLPRRVAAPGFVSAILRACCKIGDWLRVSRCLYPVLQPALIITCALAAGCSSNPPTTARSGKLYEGKILVVACPGDPSAKVVETYSKAWAVQNGAQVKVVRY